MTVPLHVFRGTGFIAGGRYLRCGLSENTRPIALDSASLWSPQVQARPMRLIKLPRRVILRVGLARPPSPMRLCQLILSGRHGRYHMRWNPLWCWDCRQATNLELHMPKLLSWDGVHGLAIATFTGKNHPRHLLVAARCTRMDTAASFDIARLSLVDKKSRTQPRRHVPACWQVLPQLGLADMHS